MADRYWVGGSANWDGTAGTKWATVDGGPGGASVPTTADNVYFTAASGAVTVTVATVSGGCLDLNFTGFTGTFAGLTGVSVFGNLTASSGMTWTHSAALSFGAGTGSRLVTCNGKTISPIIVAGSNTVSLQDAFASNGSITVTLGTFTTNNYAVTATSLSSSNSNTRTINLGSSTVTLNATLSFATSTNLTFNAGTSQINLTYGLGIGFDGGGQTFYNVAFTAPNNSSTTAITGTNTFNNLSVYANSVGVTYRAVTFSAPQTINGTLSTVGGSGNHRVLFSSATYGIAQTLTINSAPSLTDADFRDLYVIGTAAPISGTRIGDLRGCTGITFDAPKTVYWNLAGAQNWSANGWASTPTGSPSTDNFPLAQDTATFTNAGSVTGTITFDSAIPYTGTVDLSGRTSAMSLSLLTAYTVYGDWKSGSGVTYSSAATLTFSGRSTQTITSSGKAFVSAITIDTYDGTVQLADAINIGVNTLTVTNGTFSTQGYNVTAGSIATGNTNVKTVNLGSSTVTLSATTAFTANSTNTTFNAGTSQINVSGASATFGGSGYTFYNVAFTSTTASSHTISISNATFNNLTITPPASAGITQASIAGSYAINGTLACAGATAIRRVFIRSSALGTTRTLTVNSLSANDCDFRDITIAGTAAGTSPTRAGDCGGNSGITFPAPKTVYAVGTVGSSQWEGVNVWATVSGGATSVNNFPLAQDTAVIDNGTVCSSIYWSTNYALSNINGSARTGSTVTLTSSGPATSYGDITLGSFVNTSGANAVTFSKRGTQTITSSGQSITFGLTIDSFSGTVQLADAISVPSTITMTLNSGTFDAVSYNVTIGFFNCTTVTNTALKMGSGLWTLLAAGNVWMNSGSPGSFYKGTANIVLSDTSTSARTFAGSGLSYNKLTIGGTTGTSTLTISGNNQFTELASTKTVAHTIALGTTTQTFGKWSVTGSAGNVVTVTGTATISIAGSAPSGIDYLALGTTVLSTTSPAEFFAGANSTGGTNFTLTAAPSPRTLYWVGGTGNWSSTTKWDTVSGGAGGAAIPTSLDAVIFNSASNATAYTATVDAGVSIARCASFTMAGPASGNVTFAGTVPIACHGNVSKASVNTATTYSGTLYLVGNSSYTFTALGTSSASITVIGVGSTWTQAQAIAGNLITVTNGGLDTAGYQLTLNGGFTTSSTNYFSVSFGSSTISCTNSSFAILGSKGNYSFNAGTSTISVQQAYSFSGNGETFYNFTTTALTGNSAITINGANTFNNFTVSSTANSNVIAPIVFSADQTINGTLTASGAPASNFHRVFLQSSTLGTQRTLTVANFASSTDVDFRDIAISGAAAPISGSRFGDCKGNSGITFDAPKTVYYVSPSSANFGSANVWSDSIGGTTSGIYFPLAQDTAVIPSGSPSSGSTVTINAAYNIGTIDMSARTSNTMTLATGTTTPTIYGNWVNGTGVTLSGTGQMTFSGRGSQTITSAGVSFTQTLNTNSPSGSVTLLDNLTASSASFNLNGGTFDAAGYNVNLTSSAATVNISNSNVRTLAMGSGAWTVAGSGTAWSAATTTNLTVTGTATLSFTSASAKTFSSGGFNYSGITLNQGGAGALTISGNNTFYNITNTYSGTGASNITIGTTIQTVSNFTATGASGRVLTIQGTSAASPGTLILTSGTVSTPDYLSILGVRAYNLATTWYAGANSTNLGSLGWIFSAAPTPPVTNVGNFFFFFGA